MSWLSNLALKPRASTTLPAPWGGEPVDIDRFWADAWREMTNRQRHLALKMQLAQAHWSVDQDAGLIHFERLDGATLSAAVQIVGSWNPDTYAFTWAWDHPSVRTRLRADAERTRWFGERHDITELTERTIAMSERESWRLAAVAMKVNGAHGVYRGPTEGPVVFMTLRDLKVQF